MRSSAIVAEIVQHSGLSKTALSAASGISRSLIDDYLKGRSQPSIAQVERLAESAGCVLELSVRPRSKPVPDQFLAVLEFGDLFPRKAPKPLVNLGPMWRRAQAG
ncbi:helix-turn-helix transcriptional regulator [Nocardioides sp. W7]|uniref:helix-turn-helix domain-containing protein n=1 Tax=Nocardioides sp. W7 TaxID=2931390 RepID=UPI001FD0E7A4|nr:helix-turn-helix transcriptional regulator [Nocardioides sp. W7]